MTRSDDPEWVPIVNDAVNIILSSVVKERPPRGEDGPDWFGCNWVWDEECMGHAPDLHKPYLLDDIGKWRDVVTFPDLDALDWEAAAARDLEGMDREAKAVRVFCESGPFERAHHILGFEEAFIAMYDNPEEFKALLSAITDYKVKLICKFAEFYKPDDIFFHDDLGHARGPMMSLDMYREFIKPFHKRVGDAMAENGVIYTHHSCGCMEMFIDDMIEAGVKIFNHIQPCNNRKAIAEKYAGVVSFDLSIDNRAGREDTTEEDVRAEVRETIDVFGPGKNMMVMAFPTNIRCLGKIDIALNEARRYGSAFYQ